MSEPHNQHKCCCQLCVPDWRLVGGEFVWPEDQPVKAQRNAKEKDETRPVILPSPVPVILNLAV